MSNKCYCDYCGIELDLHNPRCTVEIKHEYWWNKRNWRSNHGIASHYFDLCNTCSQKFEAMIDNFKDGANEVKE